MIVVAATNFPESLDKALIRPGRFDWHVTVPNPDVRGRVQILEVHFRDVPRQDDVDLEVCGHRPINHVYLLALHGMESWRLVRQCSDCQSSPCLRTHCLSTTRRPNQRNTPCQQGAGRRKSQH